MQLIVLGLNHKTAPVEVREGFNFSADRIARILRRLRNYDNLDEAVLLSTCNRTEFYMVLEEPVSGMKFIQTLVKHLAGDGYKTEYFYNLSGVNCVRHLFKVASSLDSLVIGEGQILSQIKNAYQIARENSMTGTIFNTIFNRAIATGKRVRTETKIAYSSVSVSSAAVDLAMDVLGSIEDANILVLGAGRMSELTARHLIDKGAKTIFVSNRNFDHAKELADKFNGTAIAYNKYLEQAETSDIIITSTGAPHYVIREKDMREVAAKRGGRPLILIDIAVPRDVDPKVAQLPGITLYNIDDLEGVVDTNKHFRTHEAKMAEAIIEEEISELKERLRYLTMRPVMVQLPEKTDEKSEAYKAGYKNICEIGKERIRRAGRKIKEDAGLTAPADLDIGFRCLRLDSSNMENVYYTPEETRQQDMFSLVDNVKPDRTPEDLLFQVMLDLGVLLSSPIEVKEIAGKKVFNVADGFLLACFDHDVTEETVKAIAQMKPYYAVFRDSSMANDSVATNFDQIFETYSPETVRKVL